MHRSNSHMKPCLVLRFERDGVKAFRTLKDHSRSDKASLGSPRDKERRNVPGVLGILKSSPSPSHSLVDLRAGSDASLCVLSSLTKCAAR